MVRPVLGILTAVAVVGIGVSTGAATSASAATHKATPLATSTTNAPSGDPDTAVTFAVTPGLLTMTAPTTANLGAGAPGTTIGPAPLGPVTVTDATASLVAAWTVTASSSPFVTGASSPAETVPASDVAYDPGTITPTGTITVTGLPAGSLAAAVPVVAGTAGVGDNSATWNPGITVTVPAAAVGGTYTGTITQSVTAST